MSPYAFSLALGAMGLAGMAAIGLASHAHRGGGAHGHAGHGHGSHGHGHGHGHAHVHHEPAALRVSAVLSPRLWFTLLAGFGATGLLVRPLVAGGPLRAVLAVAGALLFEALLARPLWNLAFRFESRPAAAAVGSGGAGQRRHRRGATDPPAKEAQLEAERIISDKQRELEQTRAANAALIAQAEAKKQDALAVQKVAELDATQIAQARADAERVKIEAEAAADAEAIRIRRVAEATAESIRRVNESIREGGESYFRYKQIELLPQVAPAVAEALAEAKLVTIASDGRGAPDAAASNIMGVIQTVLAAQLVGRTGLLENPPVPSSAAPATVPPAAKDGGKRG